MKEVEIAGFPAKLNYWMHHFFEPTGVYHFDRIRLVSAQPKKESENTIKTKSSLLIAVAVICISLLSTFMIIAAFDGNRKPNGYIWIIFEVFAILTLEGVRFCHLGRPQKLALTALWLLSAFFIISNVLGEVTSNSVAEKPIYQYINSIDDMKRRNISWVDPFLLSENILTKKLPEQFDRSNNATGQLFGEFFEKDEVREGLKFILDHPTEYVLLAPTKEAVDPYIRAYFWNGSGENPFHFSPEIKDDVPILLTNFLRRGSPYTETFTRKTLEMVAAGLYKGKFIPEATDLIAKYPEILNKYDGQGETWKEEEKGKEKDEGEEEEITMGLQYIAAYLWVCAGMLVISGLVFLLELSAPTIVASIMYIYVWVTRLRDFRRWIFRR